MDTKVVSFFNFKGGQGKTTLAVNYCRFVRGAYLTNENSEQIRKALSDTIPDDRYFTMGLKEQIATIFQKAEPKSNGRIIVDFGGYSDARMQKIISNSDAVIIPFAYEGSLDLALLKETVVTCETWRGNKNIIIVINKTEPEDAAEVRQHLETLYGSEHKICEIRRSRFVRRFLLDGQSIDMITEKGALKKPLEALISQMTEFFTVIETALNKED